MVILQGQAPDTPTLGGFSATRCWTQQQAGGREGRWGLGVGGTDKGSLGKNVKHRAGVFGGNANGFTTRWRTSLSVCLATLCLSPRLSCYLRILSICRPSNPLDLPQILAGRPALVVSWRLTQLINPPQTARDPFDSSEPRRPSRLRPFTSGPSVGGLIRRARRRTSSRRVVRQRGVAGEGGTLSARRGDDGRLTGYLWCIRLICGTAPVPVSFGGSRDRKGRPHPWHREARGARPRPLPPRRDPRGPASTGRVFSGSLYPPGSGSAAAPPSEPSQTQPATFSTTWRGSGQEAAQSSSCGGLMVTGCK